MGENCSKTLEATVDNIKHVKHIFIKMSSIHVSFVSWSYFLQIKDSTKACDFFFQSQMLMK